MKSAQLPPLLNHPTKILGLNISHFFILAAIFSPIQFLLEDAVLTGIVIVASFVLIFINDNLLPQKYLTLLLRKKNYLKCTSIIKKVNNNASN